MKKSTMTVSLVAIVALFAGFAISTATRQESGVKPQATADTAHFPTADQTQRTVYVYRGREPGASQPGTRLHAMRLKGPIPARPVLATVLTDENCEPDAQGVSHCINRMRLSNGKTLVVQHPHKMEDVPCLAPQEQVTVRPG